jgi:hypothetical protein
MALPAILSCYSWSNVQVMAFVFCLGTNFWVCRLCSGTNFWSADYPVRQKFFGVRLCSNPRIAHTTSRLPGGTPADGLAEHLETAAQRLKIYRLNYLCLSETRAQSLKYQQPTTRTQKAKGSQGRSHKVPRS